MASKAWRENQAPRLKQWREENPSYVAEMLQERRLERARTARRKRLEKVLRDDPAIQQYRAEKARRSA